MPKHTSHRYEFVHGTVGTKWSELVGNEELPDYVKTVIDSIEYQESIERGLEDIAAGRTITLEELFTKWDIRDED